MFFISYRCAPPLVLSFFLAIPLSTAVAQQPVPATTLSSSRASTAVQPSSQAIFFPYNPPPAPRPKAGDPVSGLTAAQLERFEKGRSEFQREFKEEDGLGPIFNDRSCAACHGSADPFGPPLGGTSIGLSMNVVRFGFIDTSGSVPTFDPMEHLGGSLLQKQSIQVPPSAPPSVLSCREEVPTFAQGFPEEANVTDERRTTAIFGAGLVEAIKDRDITANVGKLDVNGNPLDGIPHMVYPLEEPGTLRVGRFGWKAQVATMLSFSGDASKNEMGLTNRLDQVENAPNGDLTRLGHCDLVADPEDAPDTEGYDFIDRITDFQRYLAPPPQTPKSGMRGEQIFADTGCADCHIPEFKTPFSTRLEPALRNKTLKPYSDFLLHNMGVSADGIEQGGAEMTRMRTTPLWGFTLRDFLWHNGSMFQGGTMALDEIVLGDPQPWNPDKLGHNAPGSEAQYSASLYDALDQNERQDLWDFLHSLGRPEYDLNDDDRVDRYDIQPFLTCMNTTGPIDPDHSCAPADINQDQVVNGKDKKQFAVAYDDHNFDCDCDSKDDLLEVINGVEADTNGDGVPDACNAILTQDYYTGWLSSSPLLIGEELHIFVSNAPANSDVYIFADLSGDIGSGPAMLPPPHDTCSNVKAPQNLLLLLGAADHLTTNASGWASLDITLPNVTPFNAIHKIAIQAVVTGPGGVLYKAPPVVRGILQPLP